MNTKIYWKINACGTCNIPMELSFQDLSNYTFQALNFLKFKLIDHKTNMKSLSDYKAGWSKEPQWENDCSSLSHSFLLVKQTTPHTHQTTQSCTLRQARRKTPTYDLIVEWYHTTWKSVRNQDLQPPWLQNLTPILFHFISFQWPIIW